MLVFGLLGTIGLFVLLVLVARALWTLRVFKIAQINGGTMLGMGVVGTIIVILVIVWLVRRAW